MKEVKDTKFGPTHLSEFARQIMLELGDRISLRKPNSILETSVSFVEECDGIICSFSTDSLKGGSFLIGTPNIVVDIRYGFGNSKESESVYIFSYTVLVGKVQDGVFVYSSEIFSRTIVVVDTETKPRLFFFDKSYSTLDSEEDFGEHSFDEYVPEFARPAVRKAFFL